MRLSIAIIVIIYILGGKVGFSRAMDLSMSVHQPSRVQSVTRPCMDQVELKRKMLRLVNAARASSRYCGTRYCRKVQGLEWDRRLARAALSHCIDMARHGMFSHRGSDDSFMMDRVNEAGYRPRVLGENLARGQKDVGDVVRDWLRSPHHCSNIMLPAFSQMGASCVLDKRGRKYWTLMLAAPF